MQKCMFLLEIQRTLIFMSCTSKPLLTTIVTNCLTCVNMFLKITFLRAKLRHLLGGNTCTDKKLPYMYSELKLHVSFTFVLFEYSLFFYSVQLWFVVHLRKVGRRRGRVVTAARLWRRKSLYCVSSRLGFTM